MRDLEHVSYRVCLLACGAGASMLAGWAIAQFVVDDALSAATYREPLRRALPRSDASESLLDAIARGERLRQAEEMPPDDQASGSSRL